MQNSWSLSCSWCDHRMLPGLLCHTEGDQSSRSHSCHMHGHPRESCVSCVLLLCILECACAGPSHRACVGKLSCGVAIRMRVSVRVLEAEKQRCSILLFKVLCEERLIEPGRCCLLGVTG